MARVLDEPRALTHSAIGLHEVVQSRFFNAAGDPNPLSAARKKTKAVGTVLTVRGLGLGLGSTVGFRVSGVWGLGCLGFSGNLRV